MNWLGPELVAICWVVGWMYVWPVVPDVEPES